MSDVYFSREIKRLFLVLFRELFALDTDFPYNKDDIKSSALVISTSFVRLEVNNKLPQIIVNSISYSTVGEDSIGSNFYQQLKNTSGVITVSEFTKVINFQIGIDVLSTVRAESEMLSDKVFNAVNHNGLDLLMSLGFFPRSLGVSEPTLKEQYPQYTFTSSVTVVGDCRLTWRISPVEDNVLQGFKLALSMTDYEDNPYQIIT